MKKQIFVIGVLLFTSLLLSAQPECGVFFKYKGTIVSDSLKISKLGLPTTLFLTGYLSKKDDQAFSIYELKDSLINQVIPSHQGPEFCMEPVDIIRNIFGKNEDGFLLKIFKGPDTGSKPNKPIEYLVPLSSLKFSSGMLGDRKAIIIDLGRIQL